MNARVFFKLLLSFALVLLVAMAILALTRGLRAALPLAFLVSLLVAALLAAIFAQRISRALAPLMKFAARISSGDLSARVQDCGLAEAAEVSYALDAAAMRLERDFSRLEGDRQQLAALLDSMQEAVIAVDAQGQVNWSNAALRRTLTVPVQLRKTLVHSIRDPEVLLTVDNALSTGKPCRSRAASLAPGRIFEVNATPMTGGGAVVVLHDLSEIERAETSRRDFVANVSHELRTPLTCITGYVETLLDGDSLNDQAREFLEIILRNAIRMNRLTEDLLALASIESRSYKMHRVPRKASRLIEDAVSSLGSWLRDAGLALEIHEAVEDLVFADPDALQQVFGNLIENAGKYGKSGGRILVGSRRTDAAVEFYVRDFGPGIGFEHLGRIFERFYRVDKARSRESGGTGLGLAIAKHVVLAHGGEIRCESELGSGATFLFTIPIASDQAGELAEPDIDYGETGLGLETVTRGGK